MAKYNTHQKHMLLSFFNAHPDEAFTVDEITDRLKGMSENAPGKSTVYRLVAVLVSEGALKRSVKENSRSLVYQTALSGDCRRHLHMKCLSCGKLLHMEPELSEKLLDDIMGKDSFRVECGSTTLFGCCGECAEKTKKKE